MFACDLGTTALAFKPCSNNTVMTLSFFPYSAVSSAISSPFFDIPVKLKSFGIN